MGCKTLAGMPYSIATNGYFFNIVVLADNVKDIAVLLIINLIITCRCGKVCFAVTSVS